MIGRMLLVWLLVLNLGVAAWWWLHDEREPVLVDANASAPPQLELVAEDRPGALPGNRTEPAIAVAGPQPPPPESDAAEVAPPEAPPAAASVCASFGPYADEALANRARIALPAGAQASLRRVGGARARGYNVSMPPLADRDAAQAMAARLRAAGFNDLIVLGEGANANGIALGRFGSEENARRHQAALQARGFSAHVAPAGGEGDAQIWLDVQAPAGFDAKAERARLAAAQVQARGC